MSLQEKDFLAATQAHEEEVVLNPPAPNDNDQIQPRKGYYYSPLFLGSYVVSRKLILQIHRA